MAERPDEERDAISIATRLAESDGFKALFQEGMGLIELAASYLDGGGREDSRGLPRAVSLAYATESMRLTTRLMQVASWLLLQRAVHEGEMSREQATADKYRLGLDSGTAMPSGPTYEALPPPLRDMIERSIRLQERVRHLDRLVREEPFEVPENMVASQIDRLRAAFTEPTLETAGVPPPGGLPAPPGGWPR